MMNKPLKTVLGVVSLSLAIPVGAYAITYDPATQFDKANNPSLLGPWDYGSETSLGASFTDYTTAFSSAGIDAWGFSVSVPDVVHNPTGSLISVGSVNIPAGQVALHPGALGEVSIFRFTVPSSGLYDISGSYSGLDSFEVGTTTDVHVLKNNVSIFDGVVNSAFSGGVPGAGPSFSLLSLSLLSTDTIDFAVGFSGSKSDTSNGFDTTGLNVTITTAAVPEPEIYAMMAVGLGLMGWVGRRKKQIGTTA